MTKSQIVVLGTIHEGHSKHEQYSFTELRSIILKIKPDVILGEVPPDRSDNVKHQFQKDRFISDSRMVDLPEYEAVVYPVAEELEVDVLPISAWTTDFDLQRKKALQEIIHKDDLAWQKYKDSETATSRLLELRGNGYDPLWLNSQEYDDILDIQLQAFDELFPESDSPYRLININNAHFKLITHELNKLEGQSLKILLLFGVGHKKWLREQIRELQSFDLLSLSDAI